MKLLHRQNKTLIITLLWAFLSLARARTYSELFNLECRLAYEFDPYINVNYSDPNNALYKSTKQVVLNECNAVQISNEIWVDCELTGFWGSEGGHVWASVNFTIFTNVSASALRVTSDWGVKYAFMDQCPSFNAVHLKSEFDNPQESRAWMFNWALVCGVSCACFVTGIALYFYVSAAWTTYSKNLRDEREQQRRMQIKAKEMERLKQKFGDRAVSSLGGHTPQPNESRQGRNNEGFLL